METQEDYTIDLDAITDQVAQLAQYPCLGFEFQGDCAKFVINFGPGTRMIQAVTAEQMNHICHQWLNRHKKETH